MRRYWLLCVLAGSLAVGSVGCSGSSESTADSGADARRDTATADTASDAPHDVGSDATLDAGVDAARDVATTDAPVVDAPVADSPATDAPLDSHDDSAVDAPVADVVSPPADVPPGHCVDNSNCPATEFCQKAKGDCDGIGTCEPRPSPDCIGLEACGCDGVYYGDRCEAWRRGINIRNTGFCSL